MTHTLKAKKVKVGHSIPALDGGYVVDVERHGYEDSLVSLTMHDTEGEEMTLTLGKNVRVEVDREEPQPVW